MDQVARTFLFKKCGPESIEGPGFLVALCRAALRFQVPHASIGLATMLFGVSGSWEDIDATSLPVELEPGPPSEKLTSC